MTRPDPTPAERDDATHPAGRRAADILLHEAAADWDLLFAAVLARFHDNLAAAPSAAHHAALSECLQALDGLQALRASQRGRDIEGELRRADRALTTTRAELLAARLGEQQARHLAGHDSLTSLPNRSGFRERLDHALHRDDHAAPALAVLYLDLDGFKPINDRHGHDAGDELLRVVAQRMSRSVRQQDLVCRVGGDEFACIVAEPAGREQISQIAAKLFNAVAAPLQLGDVNLSVRPSIGIAVCPGDGDNAATLLKRADLAMYRAKRRQLGFAFFDRRADS
ncbi:Diguanylate cyclase (GGDEF)-like protein [Rubrivivax sp. A210]|uniref:GGDEF domain-containing protein n=1 Tax=Rubrivivax sp. A210 TaxID=2772301 RepID=UPI00191B2ADE|nr:GGDEF domain-containing protein [Rubrivivax sp. A210]CAD5365909.1 Diguanylate cyclase (GGDEF)-like protein [Rubrivivax sp. A210]